MSAKLQAAVMDGTVIVPRSTSRGVVEGIGSLEWW